MKYLESESIIVMRKNAEDLMNYVYTGRFMAADVSACALKAATDIHILLEELGVALTAPKPIHEHVRTCGVEL